MKKPKNYWSRQELKTHFAGVNFFKSKSDHPFHLKIHHEIRSCLGDELYYCPISANDTFTDGVYKNRIIDRVYVKLDGVWYYTDAKGRAYTGERKINGTTYWFANDGIWVK